MLKKLVKAVFLTREAREALERRGAAKQAAKSRHGRTPPAGTAGQLAADAAAPEAEGTTNELRRKANATRLDAETIRMAIAAAHAELTEGRTVEGDRLPDADRRESVRAAMTVYRNKQKVLADLSPEDKARLRLMAAHVLGGVMRR